MSGKHLPLPGLQQSSSPDASATNSTAADPLIHTEPDYEIFLTEITRVLARQAARDFFNSQFTMENSDER